MGLTTSTESNKWKENIFLPVMGIFSRIDYTLDHKTVLNKYEEEISWILPHHNEMKKKSEHRDKNNNFLFNAQRVTKMPRGKFLNS